MLKKEDIQKMSDRQIQEEILGRLEYLCGVMASVSTNQSYTVALKSGFDVSDAIKDNIRKNIKRDLEIVCGDDNR